MKHVLMLMTALLMLSHLARACEAATYHVPTTYPEIRDALDVSTSGDVVLVNNNGPSNTPYQPFTMLSGVQVEADTGANPEVDGSDTVAVVVDWPTTASSGTVLEGFTIRGGTQYGAAVRDQGVIRNCTIENTSAPQYWTGVRSIGSTTSDGCSITASGGNGGYMGIYHTGGAPNIQNCSVDVSGGVAGIDIDCPSATTTGELAYCSITVDAGDGIYATKGSFSMHDLNIVAAGSDNSGIKAGDAVGDLRSTISNCLVSVPGGVGVWVVDDSVKVTNVTVDNVGEGIYSFGEVTVTNCIVTNYDAQYGYGFDNVNAEDCIAGAGQRAYETGSKGTGSVAEDPLYCDGQGGEFTLRIDSYGNPENPDNIQNVGGKLIGAFPVACMYGTLERDSKYSGAGSLEVPSDVTVPQNKSLTIDSNGENLEFLVAPADPLAAGADTNRVELIVNGTLDISGSGNYPVEFKSSASTPGSLDWSGIWLDSHGEATIDGADIANALLGIQSAYNHDLTVTNCSIAVAETLFAVSATRTSGSGAVNISGNTITVGEYASGIKFYGAGNSAGNIIQDNIVNLDDLAIAGLVLGGDAPSSAYPVTGNIVSGGAASKGIEFEEADGEWKIEDNTITDCLYGMYVDGVTNTFEGLVGGNTSAKGNSLTGCSVGFVATGDQVLGVLEHNDISSNSSGVRIMNDANPDLGDTTQGGYNTIVDNTNYCIRNTNTSGTVSAWHNYFGDIDCEDPPIPTCLSGSIDISHILCTDPTSVHMQKELVGRQVVLRAFPNPLSAGSALEFNLAQPGRAGLQIFDISGRLVRDLGSSVWSAGEHTVHWDGNDGAGRSVGNGIYFVKLATDPGLTRTVKLLVAR